MTTGSCCRLVVRLICVVNQEQWKAATLAAKAEAADAAESGGAEAGGGGGAVAEHPAGEWVRVCQDDEGSRPQCERLVCKCFNLPLDTAAAFGKAGKKGKKGKRGAPSKAAKKLSSIQGVERQLAREDLSLGARSKMEVKVGVLCVRAGSCPQHTCMGLAIHVKFRTRVPFANLFICSTVSRGRGGVAWWCAGCYTVYSWSNCERSWWRRRQQMQQLH